jgi:choline dehydrogenase
VSKQELQPAIEPWVAAGRELGITPEEGYDPNGLQGEGFAPTDVTIRYGERESTYKAYLEPILNRNNVEIIRYAQVTKVKR